MTVSRLNDLVSYQAKHNEANGENNRDGTDANFSENYGSEGKTTDAGIENLRKRQIKNFLLTLLISRGVPMLLGGDEFRRTQGGNNNAYCQDNETSWYDWSCLEEHKEIFHFTRSMIAFRWAHPILSKENSTRMRNPLVQPANWYDWTYLEEHKEIFQFTRSVIAFRTAHPILSKENFYTDAEIRWFNPQQQLPNWFDPKEKQLACLIQEGEQHALCLMFNAGSDAVDFGLPPAPSGARWHLGGGHFPRRIGRAIRSGRRASLRRPLHLPLVFAI